MSSSTPQTEYISIAPLLKTLAATPTPPPLDSSSVPSSDIALAFSRTFENRLNPTQLAALLTLLHSTGYDRHPDVIAKCAAAMRDAANSVDRPILKTVIGKRKRDLRRGSYTGGLCDIVGTGGDSHSTFNVSTTASIIASALLLMAKHGNRAQTSMSGSADVLNAILPRAPKIESVNHTNLCGAYERGNYAFLYAPNFHPGMKYAATVRRELGLRTIFNLMGPLANPVEDLIEARVVGVAYQALGPVFAEALRLSGCRRGMVVCGLEDLDEVSCAGPTNCWLLRSKEGVDVNGETQKQSHLDNDDDENDEDEDDDDEPLDEKLQRRREQIQISTFQISPADFGLPVHPLSTVGGGKLPRQNAQTLISLISNELPPDHPILHFVLVNVAALLVVSGVCDKGDESVGCGAGEAGGDGDERGSVIKETGPGGLRWKEGLRRARWCVESGRARKELERFIEFSHEL